MADTATAPATGKPAPGAEKPAEKPAGEQKPAEQKPAATTEQKPGEQAAEKPAGTEGTAEQKPKAPEKYALTIPAGNRLDPSDLPAIEALAREQDWSNEEAQQYVTDRIAAVDAQSEQFRGLTEADPVYGGAHLEATKKLAGAALDKLRPAGTPRGDAFRALLHRSGYGNHLEVVSLLADLGKAMAEDGTAGGSGGGGTPAAHEILYDNTPATPS
jgi:hypothetical protein